MSKTHDRAQTPCERLLTSPEVAESGKAALRAEFHCLDPCVLLAEIERLQEALWLDHLPRVDGGRVREYVQQVTAQQFGAMVPTATTLITSRDGSGSNTSSGRINASSTHRCLVEAATRPITPPTR